MSGIELDEMPEDVREEYLKIMRNIPGEKRMVAAAQLSDLVQEMMAAGIRKANPGISDEDVFKEIIKRTLPADLVKKAYGW